MKKSARQILIMGALGAWALIAIGSGHSHSHKCNSEWKAAFISDENTAASDKTVTMQQPAEEVSNADVNYPGFTNLVFQ